MPTHEDHSPATLEVEDTGVEFALWPPNNSSDYLYTGSSDGCVKIWSVKRGEPFVKDMVRVNGQIMCGAWSPDGDMLMVGDATGTATLLSTLGDEGNLAVFKTEGGVLPENLSAGSDRQGENARAREGSADVDEGQLGSYYARELIRTGKVELRYGAMGYGAYGI